MSRPKASRSPGSPPRVRGEDATTVNTAGQIRITPACAGRRPTSCRTKTSRPDHPRVCGEKCAARPRLQNIVGSPPRVRGEENMRTGYVEPDGITPACAGRRVTLSFIVRILPDHPRVCGEKDPLVTVPGEDFGSPPRVRGEARGYADRRREKRITPACAGRSPRMRRSPHGSTDHPRVCGEKVTRTRRSRRFTRITPACAGRRTGAVLRGKASRDHPRVCGEKIYRLEPFFTVLGSPPRVRGEVTDLVLHAKCAGITPACAGRSRNSSGHHRAVRDHPRVCGEKYPSMMHSESGNGSPPRVRGEGASLGDVPRAKRITPACAGRRVADKRIMRIPPDHPRVCGEKTTPTPNERECPGSPPRVRGEVRRNRKSSSSPRITPACAGRRTIRCRKSRTGQDHPRVCGEKRLFRTWALRLRGSPPRVRGEAAQRRRNPLPRGITPACAGRSLQRRRKSQWTSDHPRVCGEKDSSTCTSIIVRGSPPRVRGED